MICSNPQCRCEVEGVEQGECPRCGSFDAESERILRNATPAERVLLAHDIRRASRRQADEKHERRSYV